MSELAAKLFEDKTLTRTSKFFVYAPPLFSRQKSKRPLPNKPFKTAERWQTSIYYWWFEYLRRSKAYEATCAKGGRGKLAKLYADFGDVFEKKGTDKDTFQSWWRTHAHLFWEAEARRVAEVQDVNDMEDTDLVVRLALEVRNAHMVKQLRLLLRENAERVKQAREKSRAKYPVRSKVKLTSLHKHLVVYDTYVANPKMKWHEIADTAGLVVDDTWDYYDENGDLAGKRSVNWLWRNGYEADAKEGEKVVKRRKRQIARQHVVAAQEYIACVEKGFFPCRSITN
jgi:hypothetical protein